MKIDGNTPIALTLSLDQVNAVLASLGNQPYDKVAGIIMAIQRQATAQIGAMQAEADAAAKAEADAAGNNSGSAE